MEDLCLHKPPSVHKVERPPAPPGKARKDSAALALKLLATILRRMIERDERDGHRPPPFRLEYEALLIASAEDESS